MSNEINFTPEMLEQAKSAPSATALLTLAQENGITLTAEEAATYYAQLHPQLSALSDEELDNVSGGVAIPPAKCRFCECTKLSYRVVKDNGVACWCWICLNCHRPN